MSANIHNILIFFVLSHISGTLWSQKKDHGHPFNNLELIQNGECIKLVIENFNVDSSLSMKIIDNVIYSSMSSDTISLAFAYSLKGRLTFKNGEKELSYKYFLDSYKLLSENIKKKYPGFSAQIIHYYASILSLNENLINFSIDLYSESNEVLDKSSLRSYVIKFTNLNEIAKMHQLLGDTLNSKRYYKLAFTEAKEFGDPLYISSASNNLGLFYYNNNKNRKALENFQKSKRILNTKNPEHLTFMYNIDENIAKVFVLQKKYTEATTLFQNIYKYRLSISDSAFAIKSLIYNLEPLMNKKLHFKINESFTIIDNYLSKHLNEAEFLMPKRVEDYFNFKFEYYIKSRNLHFEFYLAYTDYLKQKNKKNSSMISSNYYNYYELIKKNYEDNLTYQKNIIASQEKIANTKENYQMIFITFCILLLTLITIYYFKKRKRLKSVISNQKKSLSFSASEFNSIKNDFRFQYTGRSGLLKNVISELNNLKNQNDDIFNQKLRAIKFDINSLIKNEEQLINSKISIENDSKLSSNIKELYPNLTRTEVDLCGYIYLGLANKEIATLLNKSESAIKMKRSRLRKKMNLERDVNFRTYLEETSNL